MPTLDICRKRTDRVPGPVRSADQGGIRPISPIAPRGWPEGVCERVLRIGPARGGRAVDEACVRVSKDAHETPVRMRSAAAQSTTVHDRDANAAKIVEGERLRLVQHPQDTGGVRASGDEGNESVGLGTVAVSARIGWAA